MQPSLFAFDILPLTIFVISLFQLTQFSQAEGVLAIVNKDVITIGQVRPATRKRELELQNQFRFGELQKQIKDLRLAALNDLIDRQLILQEFQSKGYAIPNMLLDERISSVIKEKFGGDSLAFQRSIEVENYTLELFKSREREKIIVQEMKRRITEDIAAVPEAEIADYYRKHRDQYSSSSDAIPLKDARDEIEGMLLQIEREKVIKEWIKKLRESAFIHILSGHPFLE